MKTLLLGVAALFIAHGAHATSVGVNFSKDADGSLASTDVAGKVAQASWNNVGSTSALNLNDSTGTATTIDLSISGVFNIWATGAGTGNADEKLMNQAYQWGKASGGQLNATTATFAFTQIAYASYDVYVYSPLSISYPNSKQSFTIGSTTYWVGGAQDSFDGASDYKLSTATTRALSGASGAGNYVRFSNLSGSSFSLSAFAYGGQTALGRIAGIQIVEASPVPEADTYAMMLVGLGALGFMSRRRKRS